jgi:hypothetical protein
VLKTAYHMLLPAIALAVALSSCAHTKIISVWKDPAYKGRPKKILVYAMARSPDVQAIFENQLVMKFEEHGLVALPSHRFLADSLIIDKDALKKLVKENDVDTIFIAGPRSRKELQTLRPGQVSYEAAVYANPDDDFFAAVSGFAYKPGTYAESEVTAALVLYDVSERKLIWSATSETYVWNTAEEEIKPAVDRIVQLLVADKIIPQ